MSSKKQEFIPAKKPGRPTDFKPEFIEKMKQLNEEGKTVVQICAELNISRDTFYRWRKENEEFKEAWEVSEPKCQAWWEKHYIAAALGGVPGCKPQMLNAFMQSKFKDWKVAPAPEQAGTTINNISIEKLNVLREIEKLDSSALQEEIEILKAEISAEKNG